LYRQDKDSQLIATQVKQENKSNAWFHLVLTSNLIFLLEIWLIMKIQII